MDFDEKGLPILAQDVGHGKPMISGVRGRPERGDPIWHPATRRGDNFGKALGCPSTS
jgi:hypothetical protein